MKMYACSVLVTKNKSSIYTTSMTLHVFGAMSELEAKGIAFEKALEAKKGFHVGEILVHCLTPDIEPELESVDEEGKGMSDDERGLYNKFEVTRTDGSSGKGGKHENCEYFVLDLVHDPHSVAAIGAYAVSCKKDFPALSDDLREKVCIMRKVAAICDTEGKNDKTN